MTRRIIGIALLIAICAVVSGNFATAAAASAPIADAQAGTLVGGNIDCGTLAGATMAAAFLAGWGAVTLIPAIIGGAGLVLFC